jgi:hypothetical protein
MLAALVGLLEYRYTESGELFKDCTSFDTLPT